MKKTNDAVKKIMAELEQGVVDVFESENFKNYLAVMSKFHRYSVNNCLLIAMQMPNATQVAGYKKWQELKRQVKKGEKAIKILAPIQHKIEKEVELPDGTTEKQEIKWMSFRAVNVFDISQTDGEALPDICRELTDDVEGFEGITEALRKISPVAIGFEDMDKDTKGYFHTVENRIAIQKGMSEAQIVKTMVHEIAHSILHRKGGEQAEADRRTKEVQAEGIAYTVCNYIGLDVSEYSFEYIGNWSKGRDVKELRNSIEVIRKTSASIIEGLEGVA